MPAGTVLDCPAATIDPNRVSLDTRRGAGLGAVRLRHGLIGGRHVGRRGAQAADDDNVGNDHDCSALQVKMNSQ